MIVVLLWLAALASSSVASYVVGRVVGANRARGLELRVREQILDERDGFRSALVVVQRRLLVAEGLLFETKCPGCGVMHDRPRAQVETRCASCVAEAFAAQERADAQDQRDWLDGEG